MRLYMIVGVLLVASPAWGELVLTFNREIDVPDLDVISGLDFDSEQGVLWIAGLGDDRPGPGDDVVIAWSVGEDQELSSFALEGGCVFPSSIAMHPTTKNLFVFWGESVSPPCDEPPFAPRGGEFTPSGQMIRSFDSLDWPVNGSTFDSSGELYGVTGGGFYRIDQETGAQTDIVDVPEMESPVAAAAFDPLTGNLFVYDPELPNDRILEIDPATGVLLSTTMVSPSLLGGKDSFSTGFTFSPSGDRVYIGGTNGGETQETLVVLNRIPEPSGLCLVLIGGVVLCLSGRLRNTRCRH